MENKPMRIAQIMGKMNSGGVESVVMNYYRNVDKDKIQFDFIVDSDSSIPQKEEIESMGGRIILVPPYQHIFSYLKELKKVLIENKYQIVHSHLNTLSVFPLFAAYLAKVPIRIAHAHSAANWKELKKTLLKYILRVFSKVFATDYFACSKVAGEFQFGKNSVNNEKVKLITDAIDIDRFKFDANVRNSVREKLCISKDTFVLGHIGRFDSAKNHMFLIDVFAAFHRLNKDSILLLVGEGSLESDVKHKVFELGLVDCVKFLGVRKDVNEIYQAMDMFLFPSLYEGLGLVLVEAQVSGLYCIASEHVPREVDLTGNISFLTLDNCYQWVDNVLNNKNMFLNREKSLNTLDDFCDYNILEKVKELECIYDSLLNKDGGCDEK